MSSRFRALVPQALRLRLWLVGNAFTRENILVRRARPSPVQRVAAEVALRRGQRRLRGIGRPVGIDRLPAPTVINLASRSDRLRRFMAEMRRLSVDRVERFDAIRDSNGVLGCALSHAECLRRALDGSAGAAMICEDDVLFRLGRPQLDVLVDAFLDEDEADVACLAYFAARTSVHSTLYLRGTYIRTAACYIVKSRVGPELLEVWERGIAELRRGGDPRRFACDKVWMPLQQERVFLVPVKRAAYQGPGYSDIRGQVVRYTH